MFSDQDPFVKDWVSFLCGTQGNMVALVHDSEGAEDEENDILLSGLSHQSHLILRAEGLATGFCKDVHGQVGAQAEPWLALGRWRIVDVQFYACTETPGAENVFSGGLICEC